MTGHQDPDAGARGLRRGQPLGVHRLQEGGDEVLRRVEPALLEQLLQVPLELGARGVDRTRVVGRRGDEDVRVPPEPFALRVRDAEQVADHHDGQGDGEAGDEVGRRPLPGDGVEPLVGNLLDATAQPLDATHREGLGHHPADPRVLGRIHRQEVPRPQWQRGDARRVGLGGLQGAEPRVRQELLDLGVAGQQPGLTTERHRHPGDRLVPAELGVPGMQVESVDPPERVRLRGVRMGEGTRGTGFATCHVDTEDDLIGSDTSVGTRLAISFRQARSPNRARDVSVSSGRRSADQEKVISGAGGDTNDQQRSRRSRWDDCADRPAHSRDAPRRAGQVGDELLPCRVNDPDLWFAEWPTHVEFAKALCGDCPVRVLCLDGALERREPWGVWGGELFLQGVVVPRKRPRGRPRKTDRR